MNVELSQTPLNRMKLNRKFVPISAHDGDERFANGVFDFNVTRLLEFIKNHENEFLQELVEVKSIRLHPSAHLDEATVQSADISLPILLAEISPGRYNIIDGNHRLERAFREGKERIPAYRVNAFQHISFLTSIKAYKAYVNYWNSKIEDMES